MKELYRRIEGFERVAIDSNLGRNRRSNPDLTSPLTKKTFPTDFVTFPQVARNARAEATSFVRETRQDRHDLKGRPSHVTVRLRVLVQKHKSASRHWRLATFYYRQTTRASQLASSPKNHRARKLPLFLTRLLSHLSCDARLVSWWLFLFRRAGAFVSVCLVSIDPVGARSRF